MLLVTPTAEGLLLNSFARPISKMKFKIADWKFEILKEEFRRSRSPSL